MIAFLKFGASTTILYDPIWSGVNSNRPSALVVAVWVAEVSWLTMVTVAPGTTAPVVSVTVPRIVPVSTCALATMAPSANVNHTTKMRPHLLILAVLISRTSGLAALPGLRQNPYRWGSFLFTVYDTGNNRIKYSEPGNHCQELNRVRHRSSTSRYCTPRCEECS